MSNFPVNEFFTDTTLTTAAVLTTAAGSSNIRVHFFREYEVASVQEIPFEAYAPLAYCKTSDVSGAVQDNTILISGTTYKIKEIHKDGTGISVLELYE